MHSKDHPLEFKVETNWCVITGAPSSGKTSVINELARRGFQTEPEVARDLIEACIRQGHKIEEVHARGDWLQSEILRLKLERERRSDPKARIFLDRGIPDSLTYFRVAGLELAPAKTAALEFRYRAVFIFDRLSVVRDGIRTESEEIAAEMDIALEKDYQALHYSPIRIPVMPIPDRTDFVLRAAEMIDRQVAI